MDAGEGAASVDLWQLMVITDEPVRNIHGVLSAALVDALRWKLVNRNAATGVMLPTLARRPPRAWSPDQTARFLAHVDRDRLAPLWRFLVATGVRRGEALGLRWRSVDFDAGSVAITDTRVTVVGGVADGSTKSAIVRAPAAAH